MGANVEPGVEPAYPLGVAPHGPSVKRATDRRMMDEHLERLKRMCNERQRIIRNLEALLAAADKVCGTLLFQKAWGLHAHPQLWVDLHDYLALKDKADAK